MSKHTPTPYRLVKPEGYGKSTLIMSGTDIVAEMIKFERKIPTGEFIVKACNNHDRLVDVLKMFVDATGVINVTKVSGYLRTAHLIGSKLLIELKQVDG